MKVEVLTCNDGLEAKLAIRDFDPKEWRSRFGEKQGLLNHIVASGVVPERVEGSTVESVCSLLAGEGDAGTIAVNLKEVQSLVLASGQPPQDEEAEGLMFHKSYISEQAEIISLVRRLKEGGLEAVKRQADAGCQVEAGQTVLSFMSIREGKEGSDVFGKPLPFKAYTQFLPRSGRGITKLDKKWVAREAGVLVLEDNTLKVLGGAGESREELIRVSEDKMKAWLVLQADTMHYDDDLDRSLQAIKGVLSKAGLRPIREEAKLRAAVEAFLVDGTEREMLILEGVHPKNGKDGSVELLVNPEPDLPDPETVHKVDFKAFTFFRTVSKGQRLARVIPPEPGVGGMDVYGNISLPKPGNHVQIKPGKNTEFSHDDPEFIVAASNGKLAIEEGIPYVVDTLKVAEDVSFKTGNLTFPGSVEVEGNVLDKFAIDAKGDVGIGGVVENGVVVSEGAILIKGGVIGGGSGLIKSKLSSVTIGFIRNQRIESHSNIVVYNEVVNGQLLARKSILMKSLSHSVIGGHMVAFDSIEIFNAGNEAGTKTILEIGKDFEIEVDLLRKREYLKAVRADLDFLEKKREKLETIVRWEAGKRPETRLLEQRVKGVLKFLERLKLGLLAKINSLEAALYNPGTCHILVSGTAYPGTVLKYKDKVIPLSESMRNKRWIFRGS